MHALKLDPKAYPLLSWRWKVTELIAKADNTGENVHAYYGDILFRRIPPPRVTFTGD